MLLRRFTPILLGCSLLVAGCDADDGRELPPPGPDQTASILTTQVEAVTETEPEVFQPFTLVAPWGEGQAIPPEYTCEGGDRVPAISWSGAPEGTIELALVLTDLDADGFVHWVAFGLDPGGTGIPDGGVPEGTPQATNDFGVVGYSGPCPPSGTHTYLLELYAVGQQLELTDGATAQDVLVAVNAASMGLTSISATFTAG